MTGNWAIRARGVSVSVGDAEILRDIAAFDPGASPVAPVRGACPPCPCAAPPPCRPAWRTQSL